MLALLTMLLAVSAGEPPRCRDSVVWLRKDAAPDGTPPEARELSTWLARTPDPDRVLLTPETIADLNARNRATIGAWRDPLSDPPSQDRVDLELIDRLTVLGDKVKAGELLVSPGPPSGETFERGHARASQATPTDRLHLVVEPADLRCIPLASGLFRGRVDPDFDRNQCSRLHPGDLVRVQRETDDGWLYVRAGHGVGWLFRPTLTPPLSEAELAALSGPALTVTDDLVPAWTQTGELALLRLGARLPLLIFLPDPPTGASSRDYLSEVLIPTIDGLTPAFIAHPPPPLSPLQRPVQLGDTPPLTRRHVLTLLFSRLMDPYGWGGTHGFRDCSALLLDTLAVFGVKLGRNSSVQAEAGREVVEVNTLSDADKLTAIRAAHARGLVFLYMPGHIMVYLGDLDGQPYALSAISEYLLPCPEGGHRTVRLDRVDVTDLNRGEGTERTSFLRRISRLSIFGSL